MHFDMKKIFRRYGNWIVLFKNGEQTAFWGFLQHTESKSWQNMRREFGPLGEIPRGQHVLLAPLTPILSVGDILEQGTLRVVVRRVETVMVKDRALYCWGLCETVGGGG